jgi:DNA integrity scanning protein DisA with diadenylate cyclase activity
VGCCDDSKNKHATAHFHSTEHPIIESLEAGEDWRWCFIDEVIIEPEPLKGAQRKNADEDIREVRSALSLTNGKTPTRAGSPFAAHKARDRANKLMFKSICQQVRKCNKKNLEPAIELAVEIAREGREGRRIGTLFTFGDADAVLARSRPLILDPLAGHSDEFKKITDPNLRGTIKELAQLDGAFVVSDEGIVVSACRYLNAMASDVVLPFGMASRHLAGASISQVTDAVAIVVSESSMVRIFDDGKLVAEIIPELWLMDHYNVQLSAPYKEEVVGDLAVLTAKS